MVNPMSKFWGAVTASQPTFAWPAVKLHNLSPQRRDTVHTTSKFSPCVCRSPQVISSLRTSPAGQDHQFFTRYSHALAPCPVGSLEHPQNFHPRNARITFYFRVQTFRGAKTRNAHRSQHPSPKINHTHLRERERASAQDPRHKPRSHSRRRPLVDTCAEVAKATNLQLLGETPEIQQNLKHKPLILLQPLSPLAKHQFFTREPRRVQRSLRHSRNTRTTRYRQEPTDKQNARRRNGRHWSSTRKR